jgi:hypothetical protein
MPIADWLSRWTAFSDTSLDRASLSFFVELHRTAPVPGRSAAKPGNERLDFKP